MRGSASRAVREALSASHIDGFGRRLGVDRQDGVPVRTLSLILLAYSVPGGAGSSLVGTAAAVLAIPVAGGVWNVDAAEAVAEGARADRAGGAGGGGTGPVPVGDAGP